jgi:anthranilate/para-aminobenzoate synthase component I
MDFSVAIRTAVVRRRGFFHVGGRIAADSKPDLEYQET